MLNETKLSVAMMIARAFDQSSPIGEEQRETIAMFLEAAENYLDRNSRRLFAYDGYKEQGNIYKAYQTLKRVRGLMSDLPEMDRLYALEARREEAEQAEEQEEQSPPRRRRPRNGNGKTANDPYKNLPPRSLMLCGMVRRLMQLNTTALVPGSA